MITALAIAAGAGLVAGAIGGWKVCAALRASEVDAAQRARDEAIAARLSIETQLAKARAEWTEAQHAWNEERARLAGAAEAARAVADGQAEELRRVAARSTDAARALLRGALGGADRPAGGVPDADGADRADPGAAGPPGVRRSP